MEPQCKIEDPVMFGREPDRYRGEDQIYEFGGPGDHYTLVAKSDKIAVTALIMMAGGANNMVFFYPETALQPPVAFDPNPIFLLENLFGEMNGMLNGLGKFMSLHYDDVLAALNSVIIGDRQSRGAVLETIKEMGYSEEEAGYYLKTYTDKKRTGLFDLNQMVAACVLRLRVNKEQNIGPYKEWLASQNNPA